MSPVLGRPPRAPRSRPVNPGAKAPGMGKGTTASGKPTGALRATRPDEAPRTTRGHEACHRGTPLATTTAKGQVPGKKRPPGGANPDSAHHNHTTTARGATLKRRRGRAAPERPDAPDWIVRGGPSSRNRRPPDWSIRGPAAGDAPRTGASGAEQAAGAMESHRSGH